jgi:DNA repair protein RecO (recombination protein O)
MATKRISDEPAFVLHRYDWSETSLILEVFTRHHGRMALVICMPICHQNPCEHQ